MDMSEMMKKLKEQADEAKREAQANAAQGMTPYQQAMASAAGAAPSAGALPAGGKLNQYQAMVNGLAPGAVTMTSGNVNTVSPGTIRKEVTPKQLKNYTVNWEKDKGFGTMNAGDRAKWGNAVQGWQNGDYSGVNEFQTGGNWGSYVDENGNVNGFLRYAGDGLGGYTPVSGGKLMQTDWGDHDYLFYGPNGEVYTVGADGTLQQTGTYEYKVPDVPASDGVFLHGTFKGSDGKTYNYDTMTDRELADFGLVRIPTGQVKLADRLDLDSYYGQFGTDNEKKAVNAKYNGSEVAGDGSDFGGVYDENGNLTHPSKTEPEPEPTQPDSIPRLETPWLNGQEQDPEMHIERINLPGYGEVEITLPGGASLQEPEVTPTQPTGLTGTTGTTGTTQPTQPTEPEPTEPEPTQPTEQEPTQPTEPTTPQQEALSEYDADAAEAGDELPPGYRDMVDQYGTAPEYEGSQYDPLRDEALETARNSKWNYDPNLDPVWQSYMKQYRREGDRATANALAQAAGLTGGTASSAAVTAAAQAGNNYAAALSDRLPEVYNDAYNRYLQEFQRQLGIADEYNQLSNQDYSRYRDRLNQWNADRDFAYGMGRDKTADERYADETAYKRDRDAIADQYYEKEFAEKVKQFWAQFDEDRRRNDRNFAENSAQFWAQFNEGVRQYMESFEYQKNRDAIADQKWWAQFNRQNFESDRAWEQTLLEYADAQKWKSAEWNFMIQQYGDSMEQWQLEFALKQAQFAWNQEMDAISASLNQTQQEHDMAMDEAELEMAQSKYAQYLKEQEDAEFDNALSWLFKTGVVSGRYADILGVPEGTSLDDYLKAIGYTQEEVKEVFGYQDSTQGGGIVKNPSQNPQPQENPQDDGYQFSTEKHPNGRRKSAAYDQTLADLQARKNSGASDDDIWNEIERLIKNKTITKYEGTLLLSIFGYTDPASQPGLVHGVQDLAMTPLTE